MFIWRITGSGFVPHAPPEPMVSCVYFTDIYMVTDLLQSTRALMIM